jgi:cardiolipin synthase
MAIIIVTLMVYRRRDPVKTMSWTLVLVLVPFAGIILYIFFGQNFRKEKIFNRMAVQTVKIVDDLSKRQAIRLLKNQIPYDDAELIDYKNIITLLLNNSKSPISTNNDIEMYFNGTDMFNNFKKAILEAKEHIHIQFYILSPDKIGNEIKNLLIKKAQEGVAVRVLYDDVGSWNLCRKYIKSLRKAGVEIYPFMKVVFPWLTSKVNYRNHRKITVIDGKVGFVGGMNVADRYKDGNKLFKWWRDTHMRVIGDAAQSLQYQFLLDWYFVTKQLLIDQKNSTCFPDSESIGNAKVQIAASGPDSDWANIMQAYFAAISKAKKYIYITTPYFMPNESIITAIKVASLSGIDVRLMLSEKSDARISQWCTMSYLSELLEAGVKVYLYRKGFNHSKTLVIDGYFTSVGSVNMDNRSFEHNFEVTAIMYDKDIARKMEDQFKKDINSSRHVNLQQWEERSIMSKFSEGFARLFSPLL